MTRVGSQRVSWLGDLVEEGPGLVDPVGDLVQCRRHRAGCKIVRAAASENHRNPVTVSYLSAGDPEDAAEGIRPSGYRSKAGRSSWLRWAGRARAWRWWSVRAGFAGARRHCSPGAGSRGGRSVAPPTH